MAPQDQGLVMAPGLPSNLASSHGAKVLTGYSDVDILSPLTGQVGCMASVDASVTLDGSSKHQVMALLEDSAVGGQPDSRMLPPHTGLRQALGGQAGHALHAASCEHPWLKWQHVFNLCKEGSRRQTTQLPWVLVPHTLPQQAPALGNTNPWNTASPLPGPSILFLSLFSELLSEWNQEPNSPRAYSVEGSPRFSTPDPGTHLPGEVWPQG